jgi:hypothetical protein
MGTFCLVTGSLTDITTVLIPLHGNYTPEKTCCCWVKGLVCITELERYVSGSLAAGRDANVGQVIAACHKTERYPGPAGWGLGLINPTHKKTHSEKQMEPI